MELLLFFEKKKLINSSNGGRVSILENNEMARWNSLVSFEITKSWQKRVEVDSGCNHHHD